MGWLGKGWLGRGWTSGSEARQVAAPAHADRSLLRNRRGSVAVEFAMLALPFSLITFSILENCVSFAAEEVLANATDEIAREMRTGQIKPTDIDESKLKQMVCNRIKVLAPSSCLSDVEIDLKAHTTFAEVAGETVRVVNKKIKIIGRDPVTNAEKPRSPTVEKLGAAGTKNTLRVFYKWPVMTNFIAKQVGTSLENDRVMHSAGSTWQNEPFSD